VDIDTRSDIYSLGVLLYELLTGKTPFDTNELLKAGLDEMRRTIREKEPERPSTRLTRELARQRVSAKSEIRNPKSEIDKDLDWIVMKCLEKDRARRYETANGLAADIQRHLNNEPVVACPPGKLYKFQKMVRRNRLAFAAGAGIVAALVIGLGIAFWQSIERTRAYREQRRLREQAQAEAAKTTQIAKFFENMLESAGPEVAKGRDATLLKEVLDKTAARIGTELTNQPDVEAYLRERIGNVY
jgi:eukaryotic-like serine/threonine-protein kinase